MICPYCGKGIPDNSSFCYYCGKNAQPTARANTKHGRGSKRRTTLKKRPVRWKKILLIILISVIAIAAALYFFWWYKHEATHHETIDYGNGRVYVGETVGGLPSGIGRMSFEPENELDYYDGEWGHGFRSGTGIQAWKNGDVYEGEFLINKRYGYGRMSFGQDNEADYYEGPWSDDEMEGEGLMVYKNGDRFEGKWVNNYMTGGGCYTYADGTTLEGTWVLGYKYGEFIKTMPDGTVYIEMYDDGVCVSSVKSEGSEPVGSGDEVEPTSTPDAGNGAKPTSTPTPGSSAAASGPTLPDIQSFSGDCLSLERETVYSDYTEHYYLFKYNGKFIDEYVALLQDDYNFKLRDYYEITSIGSEHFVFDYKGSGDVGTFDMEIRNVDSSNMALCIWVLHILPDETEMHIYWADGLNYTDTGERTSQHLERFEHAGSSGGSTGSGETRCSACSGSGRCVNCGGTGRVRRWLAGTNEWVEQKCTMCQPAGSGKCAFCGGDGVK